LLVTLDAAHRRQHRQAAGPAAPEDILERGKMGQNSCMFLDWTNWTFWVTALALVAFGFCLRDL
jgi:hypothetical protein